MGVVDRISPVESIETNGNSGHHFIRRCSDFAVKTAKSAADSIKNTPIVPNVLKAQIEGIENVIADLPSKYPGVSQYGIDLITGIDSRIDNAVKPVESAVENAKKAYDDGMQRASMTKKKVDDMFMTGYDAGKQMLEAVNKRQEDLRGQVGSVLSADYAAAQTAVRQAVSTPVNYAVSVTNTTLDAVNEKTAPYVEPVITQLDSLISHADQVADLLLPPKSDEEKFLVCDGSAPAEVRTHASDSVSKLFRRSRRKISETVSAVREKGVMEGLQQSAPSLSTLRGVTAPGPDSKKSMSASQASAPAPAAAAASHQLMSYVQVTGQTLLGAAQLLTLTYLSAISLTWDALKSSTSSAGVWYSACKSDASQLAQAASLNKVASLAKSTVSESITRATSFTLAALTELDALVDKWLPAPAPAPAPAPGGAAVSDEQQPVLHSVKDEGISAYALGLVHKLWSRGTNYLRK